ncbi:MAG: hypothetical protein QM658_11150 [Gordonia sp. (in: high G+C Gram-positive bacteria)]
MEAVVERGWSWITARPSIGTTGIWLDDHLARRPVHARAPVGDLRRTAGGPQLS